MRFNCCRATRPILNKAQPAAAKRGNSTTRSLVSAIKVQSYLQILHIYLSDYNYTSFMLLVFKTEVIFSLKRAKWPPPAFFHDVKQFTLSNN